MASRIVNLGTVVSELDKASILQIDVKEPITRIFIESIVNNPNKYNQLGARPRSEFGAVNIFAGQSSLVMSGPQIPNQTTLPIYLIELLSKIGERNWVSPDRTLYINTRIPAGESLRIEIIMAPPSAMSNADPLPTPTRGDFTYVVKAEVSDEFQSQQVNFTISSTQREFEATELSSQTEKFIDVKTNNMPMQFLAIYVEKWVANNWVAISDTEDFGEIIFSANSKILLQQQWQTMRMLSNMLLKFDDALTEGLAIYRFLPLEYPYYIQYNSLKGQDSTQIKMSIKGKRDNEDKFRFTVCAFCYQQSIGIFNPISVPAVSRLPPLPFKR
jgi:hypothetical protein